MFQQVESCMKSTASVPSLNLQASLSPLICSVAVFTSWSKLEYYSWLIITKQRRRDRLIIITKRRRRGRLLIIAKQRRRDRLLIISKQRRERLLIITKQRILLFNHCRRLPNNMIKYSSWLTAFTKTMTPKSKTFLEAQVKPHLKKPN